MTNGLNKKKLYKIKRWLEKSKFCTFLIDFLILCLLISTLIFEHFGCFLFVESLNINIDNSVSFVAAIVPMVTFVVTLTFDNYE